MLDNLLSSAKYASRRVIEDEQMAHQPILVVAHHGQINAITFTVNDPKLFRQAIIHLLQKFNADAYVFINEAWSATGKAAEEIVRSGKPISDLPLDDRLDMLIIIGAERSGKFRMYNAEILDTPSGKKLKEFTELNAEHADGRLIIRNW